MYSIDSIPMTDYGLYISNHKGIADLPIPKKQFFTSYFTEGYQITKREGNTLELNGFIIASGLEDLKTKTAALYTLFTATGLRAVELDSAPVNCFAQDGFTVERVKIFDNAAYAVFKIKLVIV